MITSLVWKLILCLLSSNFIPASVRAFKHVLPPSDYINSCSSLECLIGTIRAIQQENRTIVAFVSTYFQKDPYLGLYLGNVIDLFRNTTEIVPHFLLFEWPGEGVQTGNIVETALMLFSLLPAQSVFVSYEDGASAFGIQNLAYARAKLGLGCAVIMHLNHEQPWVTKGFYAEEEKSEDSSFSEKTIEALTKARVKAAKQHVSQTQLKVKEKLLSSVTSLQGHDHDTKPVSVARDTSGSGDGEEDFVVSESLELIYDATDAILDSTSALVYYYQLQTSVLRNYFYAPLEETSFYYPVGAPFYGYLLGNLSSEITMLSTNPISNRTSYCHFTGRVVYPKRTKLDQHYNTRAELLDLANQKKIGTCVVDVIAPVNESEGVLLKSNSYAKLDYHKWTYEEYIAKLVDTGFVLCPEGNNPETFRHYEALEVGAVPLFVRPPTEKGYHLPHTLHNMHTPVRIFLHICSFMRPYDIIYLKVCTWIVLLFRLIAYMNPPLHVPSFIYNHSHLFPLSFVPSLIGILTTCTSSYAHTCKDFTRNPLWDNYPGPIFSR